MSSTSAQGVRGASNYAAAKAGLQGFTKSLALELGRFNITVNAVAPGFVETDMTRSVAQRLGVSFEEHRAALVKNIAMGRSGQPDDIAGLIAYLVRDDAGYVSGQGYLCRGRAVIQRRLTRWPWALADLLGRRPRATG
jgi:3-oxoacyl-[acyl-carrier protein] reductase